MINKHKYRLLFVLIFMLIIGQRAYPQYDNYKYSVFNWGVRVGFNALSTNHYNPLLGGVSINGAYTNKVGYNLTGFARINLSRVFVQPELSWNLYRQGFSISTFPDETNSIGTAGNISSDSYSGNVTTLIGYNIVRNGPFCLNFVAGPSFKYTYRTNYKMRDEDNFTDKKTHYNYAGVVGFSVNISKIYFGIRYEFNKPNSDIYFNNIPDRPESLNGVFIRKNENALGFSCGVIF
jgi:hypothetical protein